MPFQARSKASKSIERDWLGITNYTDLPSNIKLRSCCDDRRRLAMKKLCRKEAKEVLANAFVVPLAVNPSVLCIPLIISWVFPSEPPKINIKKQTTKNREKVRTKKVKRRRFKALDVRTETETAEKWGRIWAIQNIEKGSLITTTTTSRKQSPPRTWPVHQESEQPTEVERFGVNPLQPLESLGTLNLGGLRFAAFTLRRSWDKQ